MTDRKMSLRDEARARLERRAARLVRLLQADAPDQILVNEVLMIGGAMRLYAPTMWAEAKSRHWLALNKPLLGFCAEDGCEKRIEDPSVDTCPEHTDDEDDAENVEEGLS